jgi:glycosyltransferase involved in cell wall biosynthesis
MKQTEFGQVQTAALVGTYVPRQCGIATFTKDLRDGIAAELGERETLVLALDDRPQGYRYPGDVRFEIQASQPQDYRAAADMLNINQVDVAIIQHEFGIYGGPDGRHVLEFIRRLRMPVITTMHTLLTQPTPGQAAVMRELASGSDRLVVMSRYGESILRDVYGVETCKIAHVPHGIPDVPFVDPNFHKDQFGLEGRTVMLTFGLLSPNKGIETAIRAMPQIIKRHRDVVYVVLGATHPHILKRHGSEYRDSLERLVDQLGVRDHVAFHNRFVTLEELCGYIGAADIYITPYLSKAQIVSGTLAYALGAGKATISTPYWYAEEMLSDDKGRLFPFGDSEELARTVNHLLEDDTSRNAIRKKAYLACRPMVWQEVARSYLHLAGDVLRRQAEHPRPVFYFRARTEPNASLPEPSLAHIRRMTDPTGIYQHAIYAVPDWRHGYCTDDNSRALAAALMHYDLHGDDSVLPLADSYLAFLHYAFNHESRRFRNFMSFDRRWLDEVGSEDVHGRALWALGLATALAPNDALLSFSTRLFNEGLETATSFDAPRAWAFSLVGIHAYLRRFQGDTSARRIREVLAGRLYALFQENATAEWPWCEDLVTYANAKLPHALILCGRSLSNEEMLQQGLRSLEWLLNLQVSRDGTVSLIGNRGWLARSGQRARFDQQPIEVMSLVEACAEAYRVTGQECWTSRARQCLGWFLGSNDTKSVLYDYHTGGCRDGLHADGPNLNEGAESTLAWLIALVTVRSLEREADLSMPRDSLVAATAENTGDVKLTPPSPGGHADTEARMERGGRP